MKHSFFLTAASSLLLSSLSAHASTGGENIHGLVGRLESITCNGAYTTSKADADLRINAALEAQCNAVAESAAEACMVQVIKRLTHAAPGAVFTGTAIEGSKQFNMSIHDGGKLVFSSLRDGLHGDGVGGTVSLLFERAGVSNDGYMIESGTISDDNNHVSFLSVPVRRRILADQVYFFLGGCTLDWSGLVQ